jgi:S1-C subfamily serine protease
MGRVWKVWHRLGAVLISLTTFSAAGPAAASELEARSRALQRASAAVVGLQVQALEDARSAATLGRERQGSGVVIADDDLVLTIGYLVLEAESVQIATDDGRHYPARVVAYDPATGFGLVQALAPLRLQPVALAAAMPANGRASLTAASGGDEGEVAAVRLVSRRAFTGWWEYQVEGALFTAPPLRGHSGAALFNERGELLGIGSLAVADAAGPGGPREAGNMFVPVDLLRPVLAELRQRGTTRASERAWLGLNCAEQAGQVRVARVTDDSPADVAGLRVGDHILRLDGVKVAALDQLWQALWADARSARAVTLEIERGGRFMTLTVHSIDRAHTLRHAEGI